MKSKKNSLNARMPLAITLIIAAFASAFFISTYSNKGERYWVINAPVTHGRVLTSADLRPVHLNLATSANKYIKASEPVIGLVAARSMNPDEILSHLDVLNIDEAMTMSAVPLTLRASDLASNISSGDSVDIYWVLDSRNGEGVVDPILILGGVDVIELDDSKNALGGDTSITVAIEETQVLRLLSATTQGRLVVVRSHV